MRLWKSLWGITNMKILFTCVGRRVELVQSFKKAANECNIDLEIYGTDNSDTAPALCFCDKRIKICRIDDKNYIPSLLEICKKEKINAIIPTIDTDLLLLSQNRNVFKSLGTIVFISAEDKIKICRDKRLTASFFKKLGLHSPSTVDNYKKYTDGFPAFIKPKDGSSSINAYKVNNQDELEAYSKQVPDYIVAPYVKGTEYTVDAFCDLDGNPIYITPRIRLQVRSGEVIKTKIEQDDKIVEEIKIILKEFKPCGPITIQLIRQETTNKDYFIEINPRFGGGAPLSIMAGANSPKSLLELLEGKKISYADKIAEDGAIYSRFDQSVRIK